MVSEPFCYFFLLFKITQVCLVVPKSYGSVENKWDIILRIDGIIAKFSIRSSDDFLETILNLILNKENVSKIPK
jgi:hypothetical protein